MAPNNISADAGSMAKVIGTSTANAIVAVNPGIDPTTVPASTPNNAKAKLLYDEIDSNPMFKGTVADEDRSYMNATFLLTDETHKAEFDAAWNAAGISGIKGHRSVGGYRASMYNALPLESVQALVSVMKQFAEQYAPVQG